MQPELQEYVLETINYQGNTYHALANIHRSCDGCVFAGARLAECQKYIGKPQFRYGVYCEAESNPHQESLFWVEDSKLEETIIKLVLERMEGGYLYDSR